MDELRKIPIDRARAVYVLPQDAEKLRLEYMTPRQAAAKWGCSRTTAYRLIDEHGPDMGRCTIAIVQPHKVKMVLAIRADARRPQTRRGNPMLADSRYQSRTARAREARRRKARPQA